MTTKPVVTVDPIVQSLSNLTLSRANLEAAKADVEFAVRESGQPFYYDKALNLYVGPDRHNDAWVVSWDANTARAAATQMILDGERSCNWQQCACKRNSGRPSGTFQARF